MTNIEQAKLIPINEVIQRYGGVCPNCGHTLDIGYSNRCRCNKCGTNYSSIDLIQALYNTSIPRAIEILIGNTSFTPVEKKIGAIRQEYEEKQLEEEKRIKQINNMIFKNSIEPTQACLEYLKRRCIKECLKGLNKDYIEIKSNIYNNNESIIYRFKKQGTGIQKSLEKNEEGKRFVKNLGSVRPVIHKGYDSNKYIIVEGIEDGLTCHVLGYNFICLNSVSNTNKLIDMIKRNIDKFKDKEMLICTDNDEAGLNSFEELETFFKEFNINYDIAKFYENMIIDKCKDINEYYIHTQDKKGAENT